MYSFITGKIDSISPTRAIIENQGIGYEVEISLQTYEVIHETPEVTLHLQMIVREDSQTLYGFHDKSAKDTFNKLISVSGIGPNTGRLILSGMSASEVVRAIQQDNDMAFKKVKGVGPKTAKRIILDLRDKVGDIEVDHNDTSKHTDNMSEGNTIQDEALSALVALGFRRPAVAKAVDKATLEAADDLRVETVIKLALKTLTGGGKS